MVSCPTKEKNNEIQQRNQKENSKNKKTDNTILQKKKQSGIEGKQGENAVKE